MKFSPVLNVPCPACGIIIVVPINYATDGAETLVTINPSILHAHADNCPAAERARTED